MKPNTAVAGGPLAKKTPMEFHDSGSESESQPFDDSTFEFGDNLVSVAVRNIIGFKFRSPDSAKWQVTVPLHCCS